LSESEQSRGQRGMELNARRCDLRPSGNRRAPRCQCLGVDLGSSPRACGIRDAWALLVLNAATLLVGSGARAISRATWSPNFRLNSTHLGLQAPFFYDRASSMQKERLHQLVFGISASQFSFLDGGGLAHCLSGRLDCVATSRKVGRLIWLSLASPISSSWLIWNICLTEAQIKFQR